ncbi:MAG: glycosyltransferase family 4 protein [Myxococcota bacterium]
MNEPAPAILLGLTGLKIGGGIAVVSRMIAQALDECVESGDLRRVDRVLLLDDPKSPPAPPRIGEQRLARGSKLRFVWQLFSSHWRQRPDLVFFDLAGLARTMNLRLPGFPPERYVIFTHGIELIGAENDSSGRAIRGAWRVLTNSEFTAKGLREQFPELADRIRATPLCIDSAKVELWQSRGESASGSDDLGVLIVGRMWAEERGKGHDQLLDIWQEVGRRVPGAKLWIAGEGDDRPRLERRARELGLAEEVCFLGMVSEEELHDLYQRAALFAMPSRQEGFGLVYAEAMWHGLPCIGSDADAAGDVISDGETGLLVPYDDRPALTEAVVRILIDPDYRARLGEASRRRARDQFAYERFKRDVLNALEIRTTTPGPQPTDDR